MRCRISSEKIKKYLPPIPRGFSDITLKTFTHKLALSILTDSKREKVELAWFKSKVGISMSYHF